MGAPAVTAQPGRASPAARHAFSSMIMAGLWALALACYITGLLLGARRLLRGLGVTGSAA
jgi:hypothetical protein